MLIEYLLSLIPNSPGGLLLFGFFTAFFGYIVPYWFLRKHLTPFINVFIRFMLVIVLIWSAKVIIVSNVGDIAHNLSLLLRIFIYGIGSFVGWFIALYCITDRAP
jgi:hypothetical protein